MSKKVIFLTCFILFFFVVSNASAELVAHYKLDETEGTLALDSSGNGFDGTVEGEPNWVPGLMGGAMEFDEENYVVLPGEDMGMTSDVGSVAMWFNYPDEAVAGIKTLWWGGDNTTGSGMGPENEMHIHIEQPGDNVWVGGEICFRTVHGEPAMIHLHSDPDKSGADDPGAVPVDPITVNDGEWHHIAVNWGDDEGNTNMYLDGAFIMGAAYADVHVSYPLTYMYLGEMAAGNRRYDAVLDEVRIYDHALSLEEIHVLVVGDAYKSWGPNPEDGAIEVPRDAVITWESGFYTDKHDLYFGISFDDVNEATRDNPLGVLTQDLDVNSFVPDGLLDWGQTYYWRVDEVNDLEPNSPFRGDVWSFQVINYPIVLEDFENYGDYPPDEVYNVWLDGWDIPTNGATSGYPNPDFVGGGHYMEDEIVHSGGWSFPLFYDNATGLSEVTRTFDSPLNNWNREDVATLTLFYYGDPDNSAEQMFVAVDGVVVDNDDDNAALRNEWMQWDIPLQVFSDQGVNLSNIGSLSIGFGSRTNPVQGGEGHVFFDDIRLYKPWP
jgi:hypothetical protein